MRPPNSVLLLDWLSGQIGQPVTLLSTQAGLSFKSRVSGRARRLDVADGVLDAQPFDQIVTALQSAGVVQHLMSDCSWAYLSQAGVSWLCEDHPHEED